jgi:hypothetical protein
MAAAPVCDSAIGDVGHFVRSTGRRTRAPVMMRATAVALAILGSCDFVAYGGHYTTTVLKVLAAIERSFV